jgi:hypothetical protein
MKQCEDVLLTPIFAILALLLITSSCNTCFIVNSFDIQQQSRCSEWLSLRPRYTFVVRWKGSTDDTGSDAISTTSGDKDTSSISAGRIADTDVSFNPFQYDASTVRVNLNDERATSKLLSTVSSGTTIDSSSTTLTSPRTTTLSSKNKNSNNNIISLRSTQMKLIMNELMNVAPDEEKIRTILKDHVDFLLEPLDDEKAVQDINSIYTNCKNRKERYATFEKSMSERINTAATHPSVKQILTLYRDFIMSRINTG